MTYVALDAGYKQLVRICFRILDEIGRRLLGRDSDKGHALVGRLEPNDLRPLDDFGTFLFSAIALPFTALSFLLLFGGCG